MSNTPTTPSIMDRLSKFDTIRDWMHVAGKQTAQEKQQDITNKQQRLSGTFPPPYSKDKSMAEIQVAQSLKNPFHAPNPQLQLIAHGAKMNRLISDPRFQGLDQKNKLMVLEHYYNKYTEPILKANGVAPPGFEKWVRGQHADVYDQDVKSKPTVKTEYLTGVTEGTADLSRLTSNILRYHVPWMPKFTNKVNQAAADKLMAAAHGLDSMSQSYHSVFQTDHSATGWLANTVGHVIGEGPAYLALDYATAGAAPSLEALSKAAPKVAKIVKFAKEGGEIFGIDKGEGKSTGTATGDAIVGPVIGMAISGAGRFIRKGTNKAGEQILNHMNAKGTQLAVMGQPFVNTVEHEADRLDEGDKELGSGSKELGEGQKSLPGKVQSHIDTSSPDFKQIVKGEQALRESIAKQYYPHKISKDNPNGSVWRNLSKEQRAKIKLYISQTAHLSAETMPLTGPHVQTMANENEIEQWAKQDPQRDILLKQVTQVTGLNPAEVLTHIQAENVAADFGINTPTQHLDQAFNDAEEYEPGEGASASLMPGYRINFANRQDNSSLKDTVSSNAEQFINKTIKYLEDSPATKSGKIYFEHPEHHLLHIAENSNAPRAIRNKAATLLDSEFGHSPSKIKQRAGWLKEHVDDLRRTGRLSSEGNIFRSTKLTQRRYGTDWQSELYNEDSLKAQMRELKSLMKQDPKLRATIKPVLKQLLQYKNKGANPETVGLRADKIDEMISSLKGMK